MPSPLSPMNTQERLTADYRGTGLTVGRHPMAHRRAEMNALGVTPAIQFTTTVSGGVSPGVPGVTYMRNRLPSALGVYAK